jgi:hypothetical protein
MFGVGHPHVDPEFLKIVAITAVIREAALSLRQARKTAAMDVRLRVADARRDPSPGSGD